MAILENPWTSTEVSMLRKLAKENTPTRVIGLKLVALKIRYVAKQVIRIFLLSLQTNPSIIEENNKR